MARRKRTAPAAILLACVMAIAVACAGAESNVAAPTPTIPPPQSTCGSVAPAQSPLVTSAAPPPATPEPTASTGARARSGLPMIEFVRQSGGSVCLPVEVLPRDEFTIGLSGRYTLDERGMLFYFGSVQRGSFWMKNTHVDLSIAFIDIDSRIVEIREMKAESLDFITPAADYFYAVEAQPGWYARNSITIGDEVRLDDGVTRELVSPASPTPSTTPAR